MSKKRDKEEQEFRFGLLIFIVYVVISVIAGVFLGWWFTGVAMSAILAIMTLLTSVNSTIKGNPVKRSFRQLSIILEIFGYLS